MNEQLKHLTDKINGLIAEAHEDKSLCGGDPYNYKYCIEMPGPSWDVLDASTEVHSRGKIERLNFLWKGELVVRGSKWGIIKL